MIHAVLDSIRTTFRNIIVESNAFWFEPRTTLHAAILRMAVGVWCLIYTISWSKDLPRIIASGGLIDKELARYLIGHNIAGTGSAGRLSILYFVHSDSAVYLYLFLTCCVTVLLILGMGGRVIALLVSFLVLGIAHRVPMLQGPGELLILGMVLYLIIDPGKTSNWFRMGVDDRQSRSTANLVVRLFQVHTILWLSVTLLSSIAETMWWNGTALWWLAIAERSPIWNADYLSDKPDQVSVISHAYLGLLGITIVGLTKRSWRLIGLLAGGLLAILSFLMAGDWLLSLSIVCSLSSFVGQSSLSSSNPMAVNEQATPDGLLTLKRERVAKSGKSTLPRKGITKSG